MKRQVSRVLLCCGLSFGGAILSAMACQPFWIHTQVECFAEKRVVYVNGGADDVVVTYIRPKELFAGDSVLLAGSRKIEYKSDTLLVPGKGMAFDTIRYQYNVADYCVVDEGFAKYMKLFLLRTNENGSCGTTDLFPWDTTIGYKTVPDCRYISSDTVDVSCP